MKPSTPRRERIMAYGGPGASKTRSWLTIADMYRKTKTKGKFYLLDTDDAYWANVEEFPELPDTGIVIPQTAYDWETYREISREYKAKATSDDWIIVDLFDKGWETSQNHFAERTFGMSMDEYFLDKRAEMEASKKKTKTFQPLEGWVDWVVIKKMHAEWTNDVLFRHKAHVYLGATQKPTSRGMDSKATIDTFGHLGAKPGGEKAIGVHGVNTVLKFTHKGGDVWVMDTAKDRGAREQMTQVTNHNFCLDYLLSPDRGGWLL